MIKGTVDGNTAGEVCWDAVIVGAGPAGTVAAIELARRKVRTLLIDRKQFPRDKVCGGCLNAEAIGRLNVLGLGRQLESLGAPSLQTLDLWANRRRLGLALPGGMAVSRNRLDVTLIEAAIEAGAAFLPGTDVQIADADRSRATRQLNCRHGGNTYGLSAKVVVMASGLSGAPAPSEINLKCQQSSRARIGLHTSVADRQASLAPGTIHMAVGRQGYVGLTVVEEDQVNVAAAVDLAAVRASNAEKVCRHILVESGLPLAEAFLNETRWQGTPGLTRWRNRRAAERLFLIGDAVGYVEPFTGEGMAAAIRSGQAVCSYVERGLLAWDPRLIEQWNQTSRTLVQRRQIVCRGLAQLLRNPLLVRSAMEIACRVPAVGRTIVKMIN